MSWTAAEKAKLKRLSLTTDLFFSEIAKKLSKSPAAVRWQAKKLGLTMNPKARARYGIWNAKHSHLRERAFRYFMKHSFEETMSHLGLSRSELRSIFTVGYRDPKLAHLRKDRRRHDAWTLEETLFMVRHAGIQPRLWIARRLKRGGVHSVKESLSRLHSNSKLMNGMPQRWATIVFGADDLPSSVKTKAGPTGGRRGNFHYRIIPWTECERMLRGRRVKKEVRLAIQALAQFQRWIHGVDTDWYLKQKLVRAAGEK